MALSRDTDRLSAADASVELATGGVTAAIELPPARHTRWKQLGQILIDEGVLTQEVLDEALAHQQGTESRLGQVLIERGELFDFALGQGLVVDVQPDEHAVGFLGPGTHGEDFRVVVESLSGTDYHAFGAQCGGFVEDTQPFIGGKRTVVWHVALGELALDRRDVDPEVLHALGVCAVVMLSGEASYLSRDVLGQ